jgi:hypothetical protein
VVASVTLQGSRYSVLRSWFTTGSDRCLRMRRAMTVLSHGFKRTHLFSFHKRSTESILSKTTLLPPKLKPFVLVMTSTSKEPNTIMEKFDGVSFRGIPFERYSTFWRLELRSMRPAIGSRVWIGADHLMRVFGTSQHGGTEKGKTPIPATPTCGTLAATSSS